MTVDSSKARSIFLSAVEDYPPDQWGKFLDEACGQDAELRRRVELLLKAHQGEDTVLDRGDGDEPADPALDGPITEAPGTVIGPYKLLQQIGEGGMAMVYMAEQTEPVERRVALKIIKPGMDTRQVIRRFEAERHALAVMDHPNIARVLDAGATDTGRPYFVMELVKGVPITEYCDEHHLSTRQRLELFVPVCQAVQHAHQKGIIHRDIKPTNVLVAEYDDRPVPKIIDFGVAKAIQQRLTERTMFTQLGQVVGTIDYMSPEQAKLNQLDIDTRSDVYSLGVLLYELLAGETPFDRQRLHSAAFDELLRIIREEEPPRPSLRLGSSQSLPSIAANRHVEPRKLSTLVRGELDWIVMKALEKDRGRRYETANALASDVAHFLADEPVAACPPSAAYRFRKFARRNRRVVTSVGLIGVILLVASLMSTWQAIRATKAEKLAAKRLEAESAARTRAEHAGRQAVDEAAKARRISELILAALESANPDAAKGAQYTVRQLLDDFSASLGDQLNQQPEVEASVRATIGNAYRRLGATDKAQPHLEAALALRRGVFGDRHQKVAESLVDLAWNHHERREDRVAEPLTREALTIFRQEGLKRKVVGASACLQLWLMDLRRYEEAEQVAREALMLADAMGDDKPPETADILHRLSTIKRRLGDLVEAERWARESVALHRKLHGNDHPETGHGVFALGQALEGQQKYAEAARCFREHWAIMQKQYGSAHPLVLHVGKELKRVLEKLGDKEALAELRRQELQIDQRPSRDEPGVQQLWGKLARLYYAHAGVLAKAGQADEAEKVYRQALAIFEKLANQTNARDHRWLLARCAETLGVFLQRTGQLSEAEKLCRGALAVREKLADQTNLRDDRWHLAVCGETLAVFLQRTGQLSEAEKLYREALAVWEKLVADCPTVADYRGHCGWCWHRLANLLEATGRHTEAEQACRQVLVQWDKMVELAPNLIGFQCIVAWKWVTCPEPKCRNPRRAIEILEACVKKCPWEADCWNALGVAYYRQGDWKAARRALQKAIEFRRGGDGVDWFFVAMTQCQAGSKEAAAKWYALALRWMQENSPKPGVRFGGDQYDYEDLVRIRSEAAALLGLPEQPAPGARQGQADDLEIANLILESDPTAAWAYQHRGSVYADLRQWQKAASDFSKAIELEPENPARWSSRARFHAEQAKWGSAIADLSKAVQLKPQDTNLRYQRALVRVAGARADEYRKDCAEMLHRFGGTDKPDEAHWVAWACALAPDATADWPRVVALAEKAAKRNPKSESYRNTMGAALYRAGRFDQAAARLTEADRLVKHPSESLKSSPAYTWFFLAMTHHRLGHTEDAKQWLGKAVAWSDKALQEHEQRVKNLPWNRRVTLKLLRAEAEAFLKSAPVPPSPKPVAQRNEKTEEKPKAESGERN